jgi:AcrR family transcriptional regulator
MQDVVVRRDTTSVELATEPREARERLTDAVTRAGAECGYRAVDIQRIARYGGLSVDEFHRHFGSKDQCLLAAFDRFLERMYEHIDEACELAEDWPEKVKVTIRSAFEFVSELEAAARLFAVDAVRIGEAALERKSSSIESAARRLKHGRLIYPESAALPDATERTLVAGVVTLASTRLLHEDGRTLPALSGEVTEMILTPYLGASRAREIAAA